MSAYRLAHFECVQDPDNRRYRIPEEFILKYENYYGPQTDFNVAKVLASDESYEEFVSQLLALTYSSGKDEDQGQDEASAGKRRSASESFPVTINEENFLCGGLNDLLQPTDDGWALVQEDKAQRVVFVPSKSRSGAQSSYLHQIGRALGDSSRCILVVPLAELDDYVATHSKDWLIVSPCDTTHNTIGDARRCVMTIARSMELKRMWMIDDSVPAGNIHRSEQPPRKVDTVGGSEELKDKRSPSHIVPFDDALAEVEAFAARQLEEGFPLALVGIPSTRSMKKANYSDPQFNKRAPTSFVYILLGQLPAGLTYDRRLPYKEDVLFAGQAVKEGACVCIYRNLHFKDKAYDEGGCSRYHRM